MKIVFNRQAFASAFASVASAVPGRTARDILKNVLMIVSNDNVDLVATDMEIGIRCSVSGVKSSSVGEALIPTGRMASILRESQDETVDLDVSESAIKVKLASGKFSLATESPKKFPPLAEFKDTSFYRIAAPVFRQMIRRTSFATDVESTRYALGGILIDVADGVLSMVATDSRRLAIATGGCESVGTPEPVTKQTIIPTKAMSLIEKSIDPKAEHVDIVIQTNTVLMRSGSVTVCTRLVEGRFPRYRDVIPRRSNTIVPLPVGPFFSAVRQAQIVTDEESRGVQFAFANGVLSLSSSASTVGSSKVEMPCEYSDEPMQLTFDPKYVADFLKVLSPETLVDAEITDADTAAVLRVDDSYTYVLMPLASDR